jgi:hypothetical protein
MSGLKIKNWSRFQHFKDRKPPWIKLHKEILERRDIMMLSDRNFKVLTCLWLLASEDDEMEGNLPSIADISFRLRISEEEIIQSLQDLECFLYQDDITEISDGYQDCVPETETETETETEAYREETEEEYTPDLKIMESEFEELWKFYPRTRKNKSCGVKKDALKKYKNLRKKGYSYEEIGGQLAQYKGYCEKGDCFNLDFSRWLTGNKWKDEWEYSENRNDEASYFNKIITALSKAGENMENRDRYGDVGDGIPDPKEQAC